MQNEALTRGRQSLEVTMRDLTQEMYHTLFVHIPLAFKETYKTP